jgi:hypothetical protein
MYPLKKKNKTIFERTDESVPVDHLDGIKDQHGNDRNQSPVCTYDIKETAYINDIKG